MPSARKRKEPAVGTQGSGAPRQRLGGALAAAEVRATLDAYDGSETCIVAVVQTPQPSPQTSSAVYAGLKTSCES